MRWRSALLTASSCALLLSGCGGGDEPERVAPRPRLATAVAERLAAKSDRVAARLDAGDTCGALAQATALRTEVTAAINTHRVPLALLEPLSSSVNELVARIGACKR